MSWWLKDCSSISPSKGQKKATVKGSRKLNTHPNWGGGVHIISDKTSLTIISRDNNTQQVLFHSTLHEYTNHFFLHLLNGDTQIYEIIKY